jgi:hypothetical protein
VIQGSEVPAPVGRRKALSRGPQVVAIQGRIVCHLIVALRRICRDSVAV